jgi:tRNA G10  N-methylase Trm11
MVLPLQLWLIEHYTKPGDWILDPMAGSGTLLVACSLSRNVILTELEDKFVQIQHDNWKRVQEVGCELGHMMGKAVILQGDARRLPELLVDTIITSPPYGNRLSDDVVNDGDPQRMSYRQSLADCIITSPPYTNRMDGGNQLQDGFVPYSGEPDGWFTTRPKDNIGNLPYGQIDAVITSPPYEHQMHRNSDEGKVEQIKAINPSHYVEHSQPVIAAMYSPSAENIGNLKADDYLSQMFLIYRQCHRVLKPDGLIVLVLKNFIRDKQIVRLDEDTIKLCEQAGFELTERHYRKITQQSFWRVIYRQKYPDAPVLDREDILVFKKCPPHGAGGDESKGDGRW